MLGWQTAVRYSLKPCLVGLCGDEQARTVLEKYSQGKACQIKEVMEALENIQSARFYYELIARVNNINDIFNQQVVEAYWLGNKLLNKVGQQDLKQMVSDKLLKIKCVDNIRVEKQLSGLIKAIKAPLFAHHSFHVFFIGAISGKINIGEQLRDECKISWGRVIEIKKGSSKAESGLVVETLKLFPECQEVKEVVMGTKSALSELRVGDWISYHWGSLVEKIDYRQLINLIYYTMMNYQAFRLYAGE